MPTELRVEQITKSYPSADGNVPILRGVDLVATAGEAISIVGPSGSGKSTLLYMIGALESPTSGRTLIDGIDPQQLSLDEQSRFRNQVVGFVFQDHHLLPQCTVLENVLIPTLARTGAGPTEEAHARQLLDRVGLTHRLNHLPSQLSGGERQRVAVCRALMNQPKVLLADEPTGNLDRRTAETIGDLMLEIAREAGVILVCVTHSSDLAARFARRLELRDGKLEPS
ncbi:MAG: ABC transporter ATP-binding protein [Planctomycetota bacterium]|nr:MAG: ABC transporter ATP-binding protein [Planctomycetota bacterium]